MQIEESQILAPTKAVAAFRVSREAQTKNELSLSLDDGRYGVLDGLAASDILTGFEHDGLRARISLQRSE